MPLASFNPYVYLISLSWSRFFAIIIAGFAAINAVFAGLYCLAGLENLNGAEATEGWAGFSNAYYFSVHTFTTVGYGNMSPRGTMMNCISLIEILCGVLCVALITGLLYGRFSRPSARLLYSSNLIMAPYNSGKALMFRVANARKNVLMELEADLMIMMSSQEDGKPTRAYRQLSLERKRIIFLPLTWTVVHPIDEESPLYNMSLEDLRRLDAQFLILIKGFDDMFSQVVHSRFSYTMNDMVWGARFDIAYHSRPDGRVDFDVAKIHSYHEVELS